MMLSADSSGEPATALRRPVVSRAAGATALRPRPPGPDERGKDLTEMRALTGRLMSDQGAIPELTEWIALRRVRRGGVAKVADCYLDHGRPMPSYLTAPLDDLTGAGLLVLSDADPAIGGLRRIAVTDTGHAQYVALCRVHNRQGVMR